ncbi:MAG: THUMP domain-containing protein [Candidatus Heimdallarchaeota archaeon]|nr:THUMP domain-containing protein [Candidatus Heimdallarchaeota archaeon]
MKVFHGLIVSSSRTLERNASSEVFFLLTEILGYTNVEAYPIKEISGLSIAKFEENPIVTLKKIEEVVEEDNAVLQVTLKLVPIEYRIETNIEEIREAAISLAPRIKSEDTWKINLRRRHSQLKREEIISAVASEIKEGKVKMENPDVYVIVEIVGKWTYMTVSKKAELSLAMYQKEREEDEFSF